jgi:hypothetical protein
VRTKRFAVVLAALTLCVGCKTTDTIPAITQVVVSPATAVAASYGTWEVTSTVGADGVKAGGALRVQMPDEWHSGPRNSAVRLQSDNPRAESYVTAHSSRGDAKVVASVEDVRDSVLVKHPKKSVDGRFERYVQVVRVNVTEGALRPGDTVTVVYGDTRQGSRGCLVGDVLLEQGPVKVAVQASNNEDFVLGANPGRITIVSGPPTELQFHAPSQAQVGRPIRLLVSVLDAHHNPAASSADLVFSIETGAATFPERAHIRPGDSHVYFEAVPTQAGVLRLRVEGLGGALSARSNPVAVTVAPPTNPVYWGDLHSHTHYSWDGVGHNAFHYARNISGLDFYAKTDHSIATQEEGTRGLHWATYPEYKAEVDKYHERGRFVTIHGYEASFGTPYGHHNVFFRDKPGVLFAPQKGTLPQMWERLEAGDALTIPHHTGKFPEDVDFTVHHPELRRNFEMYSGHGLSEVYDPSHPLAFEHSLFTSDSRSLDHPSHIQDTWRMGLHLSAIAASDDHRSKPGQPQYGLAAVRAPVLTRDAVFQGLYDRTTYATTGAKIILDVRVNGAEIGQVAKLSGNEATVWVRANGTDEIDIVEVLRWRPDEAKFAVVHAWNPNAMDFEGSYTDATSVPGAIYYVRLRQKNIYRDRIVMAWSSPVWIEGE